MGLEPSNSDAECCSRPAGKISLDPKENKENRMTELALGEMRQITLSQGTPMKCLRGCRANERGPNGLGSPTTGGVRNYPL